jgi:hypothetical protein
MSDNHPQADRDALRSVAGETREYARGDLSEVEHRDVERTAGLVQNTGTRHLLGFAARAWSRQTGPNDPDFWETEWATDRLRRAATDMATEAVRDGSLSEMEYLTGMPEYESDVSGLHALQSLERWLLDSEKCKITYLADGMGRGKTEFCHLLADVLEFRSERRPDMKAAELACNIPSSDMHSITEWPAFREWVEAGSVTDNRWYFLDEGSQAMTGYADDRQAVERLMSRLVKLSRKYGCNMIIIGHTGMDLHADLRRLADYVEKPSLKTARFYASVKRGEGQGHIMDVHGLPQARDHGFDTADEAPWSWGDALEGEQESSGLESQEVKRMIAVRAANIHERSDMTAQEVIETVSGPEIGISKNMLYDAKKGKYEAVEGEAEAD